MCCFKKKIFMDRLKEKKNVWHDNSQPNIGQLVVVIDENNTIHDFGYFHFNDYVKVKQGFKWAYMKELVNITNGKEE